MNYMQICVVKLQKLNRVSEAIRRESRYYLGLNFFGQ